LSQILCEVVKSTKKILKIEKTWKAYEAEDGSCDGRQLWSNRKRRRRTSVKKRSKWRRSGKGRLIIYLHVLTTVTKNTYLPPL
jgi:hypothetical protein